jgi:hypothetical protein
MNTKRGEGKAEGRFDGNIFNQGPPHDWDIKGQCGRLISFEWSRF